MLKRKGFTLIEMLVVVLIIAVLAAIAFPKYQLAVLKTRYTQLMVMGDALRKAEDAYYLANGKYALDSNELDLTLPSNCTSGTAGGLLCGKFRCTVYDGADNTDINGNVYCYMTIRDVRIYYRIYPLRRNTKRLCGTSAGSELGKKVCESLGGKYNFTSNGVLYYTF